MTRHDLTTAEGVAALMRQSKSETEWNDNCDKVKRANGGYPDFWWTTVMVSGLANAVQATWR